MKDDLKKFLNELIVKIDNNNLTIEEQREISEFYIQKKFKNLILKSNHKESLKYMSIGWYIYNFLYKNKI